MERSTAGTQINDEQTRVGRLDSTTHGNTQGRHSGATPTITGLRRSGHASASARGVGQSIAINGNQVRKADATKQERLEPKTAKEWIELCIDTVIAAQREAMSDEADPEPPPYPDNPEDTNLTNEQLRQMHDDSAMWFVRNMMRQAGHSKRSSIGAAAKAQAFLKNIPPLTTRANTKAFIACLATGLQRQYLTGSEVKMLMYTAQLALQAHQPRSQRRHTPTPHHVRGQE